MRIAVCGDIHGNLYALHAVLVEIRTQRPDALVVNGDLVYKFPWGAEVVDLLRSFPCQCLLGNAELYVGLWETPLWPVDWNEPLMRDVVGGECARLGAERLGWLVQLPEHASFSAGRLDDLVVVHGVPGNPFLTFLAAPGDDRSPWVQTDERARELLGGVDADVLVCGHTHAILRRSIAHGNGERTLVVNPGSLSYNRGRDKGAGRADYALLDWSAATGWQVSLHTAHFDPDPLHRALLSYAGDYPLASFIANRVRAPGVDAMREGRAPDFITHRWGDAPEWWDRRDDLPGWRSLRGEE